MPRRNRKPQGNGKGRGEEKEKEKEKANEDKKPHPAEAPIAGGRCYLLTITAELRNIIYEYALTSDSGEVTPELNSSYGNTFTFTLTCKQVHNECANLGYQLNTIVFIMDRWNTLRYDFARSIVTRHLATKILRKVRFDIYDYGELSAFQQQLRSLHKSGVELQITTRYFPNGMHVPVCVTFMVSQPEETEAQILAAMNVSHSDIPGRVLRIFWPVWALHNCR